ncbi:MAG: Ala-tRNA(Pro) deacylase [Psychromonas sp.]|jgi:Ala-tRNA(Pro) deacylase|uniref:aminoacyl-tRNA deacylase n=1 Tax=Psychromonas sp. TaxID=1884585 RepID=UPI0039E5D68E
MSIVKKVNTYLDNEHIHYQLLRHSPSHNSLGSAIASNIPAEQLVKAVVLEDSEGQKLMAILPASHKVSLITLNEMLNKQFHLIKEAALYQLFTDCDHGAVPPIAEPYNMDRVYDQYLMQQPCLYLEAGDHESLIELTIDEFSRLMQGARPLHFSHRVFH